MENEFGKLIFRWVKTSGRSRAADIKLSAREDGQQGARRGDCHTGHCSGSSGEDALTLSITAGNLLPQACG